MTETERLLLGELTDALLRLRFVADNIDSIRKRHDCCEQLQVVISRMQDLADTTRGYDPDELGK